MVATIRMGESSAESLCCCLWTLCQQWQVKKLELGISRKYEQNRTTGKWVSGDSEGTWLKLMRTLSYFIFQNHIQVPFHSSFLIKSNLVETHFIWIWNTHIFFHNCIGALKILTFRLKYHPYFLKIEKILFLELLNFDLYFVQLILCFY